MIFDIGMMIYDMIFFRLITIGILLSLSLRLTSEEEKREQIEIIRLSEYINPFIFFRLVLEKEK